MISPVKRLHVVIIAEEQIPILMFKKAKEHITLKLHLYFSWNEMCVLFMHRINVHQMHPISIISVIRFPRS